MTDGRLEADYPHPTVPPEASDATQTLLSIFGEQLVAVYLYGSAAVGGLRPHSDVDILAIVRTPTTAKNRRALARELLKISGLYPPVSGRRRPLEVSVFNQEGLANFRHPVRGEFIYGEWLRDAFEAEEDLDPSTNPDSTLLLSQVRQHGIALHGPDATLLLPPLEMEDIRRAVQDSLPDLLGFFVGDERNVILTLARMWFTMSTGQFASKDAAADWAAERMPADDAHTLILARNGYLGTVVDDWSARRPEAQRLAQFLSDRVSGSE